LGENEQKPPFPTILYKNVYNAICMLTAQKKVQLQAKTAQKIVQYDYAS
jgi:hypothetical protein